MFQFFGNILNWFNSWTGNYMLALLLFALLVKIILLPLSIMQQKNQIKGAKLRPKMMLIEKKYAGRNDQVTLRKKQAEMMELQQKEGYSAFSGCLPLLIQFPIIIILYRVIQKPLTYISHLGSDLLQKIADAIGYAGKFSSSEIELISEINKNMETASATYAAETEGGILADVLPKMTFFNADLTMKPYFWSILLLIPVLNFGLGVLTMKLSKKLNGNLAQMTAQTSDQKVSGGIMEWMMPVISLWFAFMLPSALGVYWIYQSVLGIAQMLILAKVMPMPKYSKEELEQIMKDLKKQQVERPAYTGSSYSGDRPRSLHHIDDDDEFPEDNKKPANNPRKKRNRPAPSSQERKLKPEDFEEKPESETEEETPAEEVDAEPAAEETVETTDLEGLVNAIGEDAEPEQPKED